MTEIFSAETTIDHPVDAVWARLIDWDFAARWMSGVDAMRVDGLNRHRDDTGLHHSGQGAHGTASCSGSWTQHHPEVHPGRGRPRLRLRVCPARREHARQPGGRLPDHRSGAAARPGDQVCHSQGGQRPTRRVRRNVPIRIGAAVSSTGPARIGPGATAESTGRWTTSPTDRCCRHARELTRLGVWLRTTPRSGGNIQRRTLCIQTSPTDWLTNVTPSSSPRSPTRGWSTRPSRPANVSPADASSLAVGGGYLARTERCLERLRIYGRCCGPRLQLLRSAGHHRCRPSRSGQE